MIDNAIDLYAIESNKGPAATVSIPDWTKYIKRGTALHLTGSDLLGHTYGPQTVDQVPSVPALSWNALSDVTDANFWSPYTLPSNNNQNGNNQGPGGP